MSNVGVTIRNYAELGRISNLPTCMTNVLVGCTIGAGGGALDLPTFVVISLAVSLFYVAGMALNDVADLEVDRIERPQRPIPSGRINRRSAGAFAVLAMAAGLSLTALFGVTTLELSVVLVACIVCYDWVHKRWAPAALLMGLCRGLVYCVAAVAVSTPADWSVVLWFAGILALYTVAVTIIARMENVGQSGTRRYLALALPIVVLSAALVMRPQQWHWPMLAGLILLSWQYLAARHLFRRPPRTKQAVLGFLAGMCLIDMFLLCLLDRPEAAALAFGGFVATVLAHRRILGT